jgi:hypothetical protein
LIKKAQGMVKIPARGKQGRKIIIAIIDAMWEELRKTHKLKVIK